MNDKMQMEFELFQTLENHVNNGISLYLAGKKYTPLEVVDAVLVKEENVYMADYVRDDEGSLVQVRYDKIDAM